MYEAFYSLNGAPFMLSPDPKFYFGSRSHNKALAYLHYGLRQAEGFVVISGAAGVGKSILIAHLLDQLSRTNTLAVRLPTASIGPGELVDYLLSAFQIEPTGALASEKRESLQDYLYDQRTRGRRALVIVDEAQKLSADVLEELRLMANLDCDGSALLQVFLFAQPEFQATIEKQEMTQFRQRIISSYQLENLSGAETREYVLHRLTVAGWKGEPAIDNDAFPAIFETTLGLPRHINALCQRILVLCALEKRRAVSRDTVMEAAADLGADQIQPYRAEAAPEQERSAADTNGFVQQERESVMAESVFDKLSKLRGVDASSTVRAANPVAAPTPATLTDLASAISAAGERGDEKQTSAEDTGDASLTGENAEALRNCIAQEIEETRRELKAAHANLSRLRLRVREQSHAESERKRAIEGSLARAEALLAEIREAWRA